MRSLVLAVPETRHDVHSFAEGLSRRSGEPVTLLASPSHAGLLAALDGGADAVWAPPLVALALHREGRAEPLVAAVRGGRTSYPAVLVAQEGASLRLGQAPPLTLAVASPLSAAGGRVASLFLAGLGQRVRAERTCGSHEAVVRAVLDGRAELGATYGRLSGDAIVVPHARDGGGLRVLAVAGVVPADAIVVARELAAERAAALRAALVSLDAEELGAVRRGLGVESFASVDAAHLRPLVRLTTLAHDGALARVFGRA